MALYKCSVCNLILEEEHSPLTCPKCGLENKFEQISDTEKIYNSEKTNVLLSRIIELSDKLIELSLEGIKINLDPTCLKVFELTKDKSWQMKQLAKSEIESHVKKSKW